MSDKNILQTKIDKEFDEYISYIQDRFYGEYMEYIQIGILSLRNNLMDIFETNNLNRVMNIILGEKAKEQSKASQGED